MEQAMTQLCRIGIICLVLSSCGGGSRSTTITETLIEDPLFADQWHLNSGSAAEPGINVQPIWNTCNTGTTCRGEDIRVAVVDDGMEIYHPDLMLNIAKGLSYNYIFNNGNPTPVNPYNGHGTCVAGIIAARDFNGEGGRGVAPRAKLIGYNSLTTATLEDMADALGRSGQYAHVSSNSWGPEDNTGRLAPMDTPIKMAIDRGLIYGRNGLGTVYVFAAGNGGSDGIDNSNYDGFANYRRVIAVAALNNQGTKSTYSEPGANILVSAPGGEFCGSHPPAITTTDLTQDAGYNYTGKSYDYSSTDYTKCMNGTSAATPMVSGTVALMLQANPKLTWRDVRYILATTARKNDDVDPDWVQNSSPAGHWVNHKYGFGAVDTAAAVNAAKGWTNLGPQLSLEESKAENVTISDHAQVNSTISIINSQINKIEAVEISFSATHPYSGDLEIILTSPTTTQSVLAENHSCESNVCTSYQSWVFSSVRYLDESANGDWKLSVTDKRSGNTGTFESWTLRIYGRS